jgi:hypothetical protein
MNSKLNQLAKTCIFAVVGGLVTAAVLCFGAICFLIGSFHFLGDSIPYELIGCVMLMPGGLLFGQLNNSLGVDQTLWVVAFIQAFFWSVVWWIVLWINRPEDADPQAAVEPRE